MPGDSSHEQEAGDDLVPGDASHTDQGASDAGVEKARPTSPALKLTLTVAASTGMVNLGVDGDKDLGGWGFDDQVEELMLEKHSTSKTSSTTHGEPPRSGVLHAFMAEKKNACFVAEKKNTTASTLPKAQLERADNSLPPSGAVSPLSLSQEIAFDMIQLIPPLSGLLWREVDPGIDLQAHEGRVLSNPELSAALATKTVFTSQEWDAFGIRDLRMHDLVRSGDTYFTPAPSESDAAGEQTQMQDEAKILAEIADSTCQLNAVGEPDMSSSAVQQVRLRVLSASTVKVVWSPAPKPDMAPWLRRRPQSSASQYRIRPSSSQGFVGSISPAAKLSPSAPRGASKPNVRASSPSTVKELFTSPLADRATGKTFPRPFSHIGNHRDMGTSLHPAPNLRASSPTAVKELFTFPLADRATGKALPRPFSHIGNHRDMGKSLQPTRGEYSVATKRRAQTTTPGRKSAEAGGTWPPDDDIPEAMLVERLRFASTGPKQVSKRRHSVPQAVSASKFHLSASKFQASGGNQMVEHQGNSESYDGKITLRLPRSGSDEAELRESPQAVSASKFHVSASKFQASAGKQTVENQGSSESHDGKITLHLPRSGSDEAESRESLQSPQPSPLRELSYEYSSEAGELIREYSFERSSKRNGADCPPHASGAHHSKRAIDGAHHSRRAIEAVHHQRTLHGLPHSWNAATAIELQLARAFQRRTELNHVAALDDAPPGVHACKSVQLAARKCAGLRRGAARLVTQETDTSGGVYGFLRRHSADITQLLDADVTALLPQYLQEACISTSGSKQAGTALRTVGAGRRFDERNHAENHLDATGRENDRTSDASKPMPRSMGSHTPLGSATPSKCDGIGNVLGAVGYMTSGPASPFNFGRSNVKAEADIPPADETFQPGCYDQDPQVHQGGNLLPGAGRGNNVTGGRKRHGEVLKEWSWEEDTLHADTSFESQLGADGSEHFDEPAQRGNQFIGEVMALLEHGSAFQSPAQKKRSLSNNLARRLSQQRRLQNAVHTQPVVNPSPGHQRGQKSR